MRPSISRRQFIATAAASAAGLALKIRAAEKIAGDGRISFFVIGDTHYLADAKMPSKLDPRSDVCGRLLEVLNKLPGSVIPEAAGGGAVAKPLGLIHAGDLIHTGDVVGGNATAMQETEYRAFTADFGLGGTDGRLQFPVYELHGNHDGPQGKGIAVEGIIERNKRRPGLANVSPNGLHYSWDWGRVHFVNLGLLVGEVAGTTRQRHYPALGSLDFLVSDLAAKVGTTRRPVVISHHLDIVRNIAPCDPQAARAGRVDWDPCDLHAFHDALRSYNIAAIFYGHTHKRQIFKWDGQSAEAQSGLPVFNVTTASHWNKQAHGFFYVEISEREIVVREYASANRWGAPGWTPAVWRNPIAS